MMRPMTVDRRRWTLSVLLLSVFGCAVLLPSCAWDGHLNVLGYSTRPNYDMRFKTIRVPIFKNRTWLTATPLPGVEMDLTRAVIREIEQKTPYKVVQCDADTELTGTIVNFYKILLNYTQFNTIREAETGMVVELYWKDLRSGTMLSGRARCRGEPILEVPRQPILATTPDSTFPPGIQPAPTPDSPVKPSSGDIGDGENPLEPRPLPIVLRSIAHFRPELGESITTSLQQNIDRMAVQIVSAMELAW